MPGPGVTASSKAAAKNRASWVNSGMLTSLSRSPWVRRPGRRHPPGGPWPTALLAISHRTCYKPADPVPHCVRFPAAARGGGVLQPAAQFPTSPAEFPGPISQGFPPPNDGIELQEEILGKLPARFEPVFSRLSRLWPNSSAPTAARSVDPARRATRRKRNSSRRVAQVSATPCENPNQGASRRSSPARLSFSMLPQDGSEAASPGRGTTGRPLLARHTPMAETRLHQQRRENIGQHVPQRDAASGGLPSARAAST